MECQERRLPDSEEYFSQFLEKSRRLRIPLSGSIEVTHGCNLRCIHCYLGPRGRRPLEREMPGGRIFSLIDEITDAGCLNLLITGGEPLLRPDFPAIYRHAKERGLLVTVFSNGTLISEEHLQLFADLPPLEIEISLYGSTARTYEEVTRVPGSYARCMRGIKSLLDGGVKVNLKTILMTVNRHELHAMEEIAKAFGVRFRFDAAISPCIDGERTPLALRVSPEEAIEIEFSDSEKVARWKRYFEKAKDHFLTDDLYGCGAGVTGFHIDPKGFLQPCIMTLDVQYDLSNGSFQQGWAEIASRLRERKAGAGFACRGCDKINLCGYCPAFFRLENGAEDARSEYLCRMGEYRHQRIKDDCPEGDDHGGEGRKDIQAAL